MPPVVWRITGICTSAIWIYLAFFRGAFWKLRESPTPGQPLADHSVNAIIPARDERDLIGRTVASLHSQRVERAGPLRVILADDESSDGTAAASNADLVVRVEPRPSGWKGKLWALESGIAGDNTNPEYLLLTDADIEYVSP